MVNSPDGKDAKDTHFRRTTMTKTERETYRRRLMALRDRLSSEVSHLADEALNPSGGEGESNLSHVPIHMADLGSDSYEHDNTLNLMANEKQILEEITLALARVDQETFGRCEECRGPIPKERLKELPYTRYCVTCARKLEPERS
jgi:RNA polymerase-binding transcription factor DksA